MVIFFVLLCIILYIFTHDSALNMYFEEPGDLFLMLLYFFKSNFIYSTSLLIYLSFNLAFILVIPVLYSFVLLKAL